MVRSRPVWISLLAVAVAIAGCQATAATDPQRAAVSEPAAQEPELRQADGTMRHLYSVPFTVDRSILATVAGLITLQVARTTTGGELEVTYPAGVPYPRGTGTVRVLKTADPDRGLIFDFLAPPPELPERPGWTLVTSHRVTRRATEYLVVWREEATGEHSIVLFDAANPRGPAPVIARTRAAILGVAYAPSKMAADYYITAWTMAEKASGDGGEVRVVAEAFTWRPAGS